MSPPESRRLRLITLCASILLHIFLLLALGLLSRNSLTMTQKSSPERERLLAFRLVETPASARVETPPDRATAVSDKNARAQNPEAPEHLPDGEAYSPLRSPLRGEGGLEGTETGGSALSSERTSSQQETAEAEHSAQTEQGNAPTILRTSRTPKFSPEVLGQPITPPTVPEAGGGEQDSRSRYIGPFSLNTYAWDWAPYVLQMKRKLERNLYPPPAFTRLGIISGNVVLRFRVMPDGHVEGLTVEDYDCHPSLVETSVQAVRSSSPFKPLPRDFPEPYLELRWTFMYIVYR